jgi:hypothetical protein
MTKNCDHPGCIYPADGGCCEADESSTWFCTDHGSRGGDTSPACCWKCGGYNADEIADALGVAEGK